MDAIRKKTGYSADVQMELSINGHVLSIGQMGLDFIMLDSPIDHPPTNASIWLSIDGKERRWTVHLPDGIQVSKPRTRISRAMEVSNGYP